MNSNPFFAEVAELILRPFCDFAALVQNHVSAAEKPGMTDRV
jgi:hypothetical protein